MQSYVSNMYHQSFIQRIMVAYCEGIPVWQICDLVDNTDEKTVNDVIDTYADLCL